MDIDQDDPQRFLMVDLIPFGVGIHFRNQRIISHYGSLGKLKEIPNEKYRRIIPYGLYQLSTIAVPILGISKSIELLLN
tara:strand:+ start:293 stop:529 length:237 start_codon:yes stop_codon:yes gene_type:complete